MNEQNHEQRIAELEKNISALNLSTPEFVGPNVACATIVTLMIVPSSNQPPWARGANSVFCLSPAAFGDASEVALPAFFVLATGASVLCGDVAGDTGVEVEGISGRVI